MRAKLREKMNHPNQISEHTNGRDFGNVTDTGGQTYESIQLRRIV